MTKFIKLTEKHTSGPSIPIIVNTEHILTIKPSERSKDTHIYFKDLKYIFISETIDEIWNMLVLIDYKASSVTLINGLPKDHPNYMEIK